MMMIKILNKFNKVLLLVIMFGTSIVIITQTFFNIKFNFFVISRGFVLNNVQYILLTIITITVKTSTTGRMARCV